MRSVRRTGTGGEMVLRRALVLAAVRFRSNPKDVPGSPDVVIDDRKTAVFMHGCFWHGCPKHYRAPKTRPAYWQEKVSRTQERDRATAETLRRHGWRVVTVWEHELKTTRGVGKAVRRILGG